MQKNARALGHSVLACLIWLVLTTQILATTHLLPITLDADGSTSVGTGFLLYTDPNGQLGIADILQKDQQQQFQPVQSQQLNTGYTSASFWLKFVLHNGTSEEDWHLVGVLPYLNVKAWRLTSTGVVQEEPTDHRPVIPIVLKSGTLNTFFVRVQTPYLADLHFRIMNRRVLTDSIHRRTVFVSIIAGCFLSMVVYNFFLLLSLRDRNYFYYLLFALINIHLNLMAAQFPANIMTWFGINWWALEPLYVPMAPMVTLVFARSFLQTKQHLPRLDTILRLYMVGLGLLMLAYLVVPRAQLMNIINAYMVVAIGLLLLAGFRSLQTGFKPAAYFLAGLGTFLIGMLILLMKSMGILQSNYFTNNIYLVGHSAEMLLMSLALGGRIKLLEAAKTRAEVTVQVKSRLLRIISHDIVTPLTVVKATAYYLKKESHDIARVERIVRAATIIEDIVGFIRKKESMESGEELELGPVLLQQVFDEIAFLFQDKALEKRIELNFSLEHPGLAIQAEPVSFSNEVMGNLVSNAIKYSFPDSRVDIDASLNPDGRVIITISDSGLGMDAGTLESFFDPSKKQRRQGTNGEKGIGFGMPLAKAYIDAYGGKIEVESRAREEHPLNSGTTVRIVLDAAAHLP
ncbi:sensor histidine kinase [Oligoflexus tunisiensis]|uniref:sensor histidine kinase n=1 Tax=Oligoflexus tunisiensis TaxID=708132 RepID=UPI00114C8569|nr:sensor histidine kinase [Oligoflexus tunisiensis]